MDNNVTHHKNLVEAGRWTEMSFTLQMANIGSEVQRAVRWKEKGKKDREKSSADRALELLDLTISGTRRESSRKELYQLRNVLIDYFSDSNDEVVLGEQLNHYFNCFAQKAAKER